jgi:DNA polymerase-3 subunit gamma/tau
MELYKKHRPDTLDDMIGNEGIVAIIKSKVADGSWPHASIFVGESGCGKTTLARIVARELGCHETSITEMNSASFRGVDTAREVCVQMNYSPMSGPLLVWIFDEVHRWTPDAQDAFLKAFEDTPEHVYFILATTDPQKLKKALLNRLTPFTVEPLTPKQIGAQLLVPICTAEGVSVPQEVLKVIARGCNGSSRAALVALEKVMSISDPAMMLAVAQQAVVGEEVVDNLCKLLLKRDWVSIAAFLKVWNEDPEKMRRGVLGYMQAVCLNAASSKDGGIGADAFDIACCFEKNFYDTGKPGLTIACYQACHPQ